MFSCRLYELEGNGCTDSDVTWLELINYWIICKWWKQWPKVIHERFITMYGNRRSLIQKWIWRISLYLRTACWFYLILLLLLLLLYLFIFIFYPTLSFWEKKFVRKIWMTNFSLQDDRKVFYWWSTTINSKIYRKREKNLLLYDNCSVWLWYVNVN